MQPKEQVAEALVRWDHLKMVQEVYPTFDLFLLDVIEHFMGFNCTDIQRDIGDWVAHGPQYRMVQAQRGQAKTTITAAYAVWRLIHAPNTRVLIVSSGEDMATEIANWVIQIISGMEVLECLRPDRGAGDREAVTAYDVHHSLKGPEKSPSIACIGITSSMQGKRADLLIADDVESSKNSRTQTMRALLEHLTKDFVSINSDGDIIYLGTPQNVDSIYNGLPGRGFAVRIWTGRYPTPKELPNYNGMLAPMLMNKLQLDPSLQHGGGPTGDRGQVTDPVLLNEHVLTKKEIDQGAAYFNLQHMLSTALSDADRYPLKVSNIRFCGFDAPGRTAPMTLNFVKSEGNRFKLPEGHPISDQVFRVQEADDFGTLPSFHMYVDPAGGGANGDETAYAVTGFLAGRVFVVASGGVPGGLEAEKLELLTNIAVKWKPLQIDIERNFGNGALSSVWQPSLFAKHPCSVEDVWETGQKELRIIDVLEPVIGSGKLVMDPELLQSDWDACQKYSAEKRGTYSLFWQMSRITRDPKSLIHDDRLDALAGSVRHWVEYLKIDDQKAVAAAKAAAWREMVKNPLGEGRALPVQSMLMNKMGARIPSALTKHGLGRIGHLGR